MGIVSILKLDREHQRVHLRDHGCATRWRATGFSSPAAARVHPRFKTPAVAIVAQAVWTSVLVLSGSAGR